MANCERCFDRYDRVRPGELQENGDTLCDDCCDAASEMAYERFIERYHGGSGPVTIEEQYQAAARQKQELDR